MPDAGWAPKTYRGYRERKKAEPDFPLGRFLNYLLEPELRAAALDALHAQDMRMVEAIELAYIRRYIDPWTEDGPIAKAKLVCPVKLERGPSGLQVIWDDPHLWGDCIVTDIDGRVLGEEASA